jgi:hypothetical protein
MSILLPNGRYSYTHYWATGPDRADARAWRMFCADSTKFFSAYNHLIYKGQYDVQHNGGDKKVVFLAEAAGEYGEFSFSANNASFCFCRTDFKPFDLLVKLLLLSAKKNFGDWLKITSDGSWDMWQDAVEICRKEINFSSEAEAAAYADFSSLRNTSDQVS